MSRDPPPPESERLLLTVAEASARLAIPRSAIYPLLMSNIIVSVKIGRLRRVPASALEAYVQHLIEQQVDQGV